MKNLFLIAAFILSGTLLAQVEPTEVKKETEVKTVKTNHGDKVSKKSVKVVTKSTANVELDENDKDKIDQSRVESTAKVEKEVYVDNGDANGYNFLNKETFYVSEGGNYAFSPNKQGFGMTFTPENEESVAIGNSWVSSNEGYYIVDGETHAGIGHFNANGYFVVEYYNNDTKQVEVKVYKKN
ncbi:hypothetical protein [Sediminicola sp. 1XM1-17]|uniref:hypothetical protein n=1 Tax=Sediminicola sp. 1XM1-17 TaxID=3127702 RepID=UPI0030772740